MILLPYPVFLVFAGKILVHILLNFRIRTVSERKIPYALSFFIPFQNKAPENISLTFDHLVSLCRKQGRARPSNAVVRLKKNDSRLSVSYVGL